MSSYESRRNNSRNSDYSDQEYDQSAASMENSQKEQEHDSTKKLAKTAAKGAAMYFGGPEAGAAVDAISKTKAGNQILNKGAEALEKNPGVSKAAKKLDDAGAIDKANQALSLAGGSMGGGAGNGINPQGTGMENAGGSSSSLGGSSSSLSDKAGESSGKSSESGSGGTLPNNPLANNNSNKDKNEENTESDNSKKESNNMVKGIGNIPPVVKTGIIVFGPALFFLFLLFLLVSSITGATSNFDDALGISNESGFSTGNLEYQGGSPEATDFYKRVMKVKDEYMNDNISVDPLQVVAVYHVLNYYKNSYDYNYMTEDRIREIIENMLHYDEESGSKYYSAEEFKYNLENKYFPKYFPFKSKKDHMRYTEEVFDYIDKYYQLIGYNQYGSCAASGACTYNIKGFYIYGKGNINKDLNVTNLKVRLMQSGTANNHNYGGTFGQPLEGEELVDFEKYILGVAYAEIGSDAPEEAIKAQMVAARSYILARSTDMGGWRTLKQENGMWVIQVAASTQDQVYCDPDRGCSSNDGQWGQVHSGLDHYGGYRKNPLPQDSRMRTLANETMGEVLVNSQGYIIYSGYMQEEQNQFTALAKQGMNYKQILLQVYNSGNRQLGASDIQKMSCNNSSSSCAKGVTGDFAAWKQYQGPWISVPMGNSGKTIEQIGCLVTSISMQIARSGVPTNIQGEFNPGTFVEYLNTHGGFDSGGNLIWAGVTKAAPTFVYQGKAYVAGYSRGLKYQTLTDLLNKGYYVVAEVKGNTGQHWVAVVSTQGGEITMMDPGSTATSMWQQYNSANTSTFAYFRAG